MLHRDWAIFVLATATLAMAGCGGSSKGNAATTSAAATTSSASTTPVVSTPTSVKLASGKPLSPAAWIARGDAVCARANVKLSSITIKSQQDYARVLPQAALYNKAEAAELAELVPPQAKAGDWKQIVGDLQLIGGYAVRLGEYTAVKDNHAAAPLFAKLNYVRKQEIAVAKRDGFKACSIP